MLQIITSLSMLLVGALAQAQVRETRVVSTIDRINVTDGIQLIYDSKGSEPVLSVEASDAASIRNIRTESNGSTLTITKASAGENAKVYVSGTLVNHIKATKGSIVSVDQLSGNVVTFDLNGGSTFRGNIFADVMIIKARNKSIANVRAIGGSLSCNFSTESRINLSGKVSDADISAESGAFCSARNLLSDKVSARAEGASEIVAHAKNEIRADLSDSARLTYYGKPRKVSLPNDAVSDVRRVNTMLTAK